MGPEGRQAELPSGAMFQGEEKGDAGLTSLGSPKRLR